MAGEATPIQRLVVGETRTLLEANTGNQVIDALNRIIRMEVKWVSTGNSRFEIAGENAILFLSTADMPS